MSSAARIALFTVAVGCSDAVTVDTVCEDLDEECPKYYYFPLDPQECIDDGARMQSAAAAAGCTDKFDSHLYCVDESSCQWMTSCQDSRQQLDLCITHDH